MVWLILSVFVWGLVHSWLASSGAKTWFRRWLGAGMRYYRFGYNVFSVVSFAPILWLMLVLPDRPLYEIPMPCVYLSLIGQGLAVLILVAGVLHTDALAFMGLRQFFELESPSQLVTRGLYRYVRHPLYTAGLLFIWLSPSVSVNSLVVYVALTVYIVVGAYFEERKLLREFGAAYADYQAVTPMLVPGLVFKRNKSGG